MAQINLLPWRLELRELRQKQFIAMWIAAGVVTLLLALFIHWINATRIDNQQNRNQFITQEINRLKNVNAQIKSLKKERQALIGKIEIIQNLQRDRYVLVQVLDEIVNLMPMGIYLTKFKQTPQELTLDGTSDSNSAVSALMRRINHSNWLMRPLLSEIKAGGRNQKTTNLFSMKMLLKHSALKQDVK